MHVGCYKQMSTIKEGVIMRLQCILYLNDFELKQQRNIIFESFFSEKN